VCSQNQVNQEVYKEFKSLSIVTVIEVRRFEWLESLKNSKEVTGKLAGRRRRKTKINWFADV